LFVQRRRRARIVSRRKSWACPLLAFSSSVSRGKQILLVDFSNLSASEVEETVRAVPEVVTTRALGSVLLLADFTDARFDEEALRSMKETAVFNKLFVRKTAWAGADSFPELFRENLKSFSGREFPVFKSREEALEWLAAD
jgi:hypothetical protein